MPVHLYNSLTQSPEPLTPLVAGTIRMYACGVTVYDDAHLGHLRAAIVFDLFRRVFRAQGWQVTYVRNITDVDDKIIAKAQAEAASAGSLKAACRDVAARYTERYHRDLEKIGIPKPDHEPKATEHIPDMIELIKKLVAKGHAYVAGDDVYFRVRSWPAYGRLSHQAIEELQSGARVAPANGGRTTARGLVAPGEQKQDPLDFALWKASKPEEPSWESPWGPGRPGWHIECSAMSMRYLGESFDIHGGGRDLIFPHHENEIAQSEAATGQPFARCWVHSGLVTVDGQKMAKSIGNVIGVDQLLARHANPDVIKLLLLAEHYSSPLDFTWEKHDEVATAYQRFITIFETVDQLAAPPERGGRPVVRTVAPGLMPAFAKAQVQFETALAENVNSPLAIAALFDLVRLAHEAVEAGDVSSASAITMEIKSRGTMLGLFERPPARVKAIDPKVRELLEQRNAARRDKDFKKADQLRQEIQRQGFIIEDTSGGTICRPI